jgi:hypothetical protein
MADLGAKGFSTKKQLNSSYPFAISGLGKITGVVKQNGVDVVGTVTLIDEILDVRVATVVGASFAFKGISLDRKFTIIAQNMQSISYNALVYDRVSPVALP